jgi:hypothetical protein
MRKMVECRWFDAGKKVAFFGSNFFANPELAVFSAWRQNNTPRFSEPTGVILRHVK